MADRQISKAKKLLIAADVAYGKLSVEAIAAKHKATVDQVRTWSQHLLSALEIKKPASPAKLRKPDRNAPSLSRIDAQADTSFLKQMMHASEHKEVVVLFADVAGSTKRLESRDGTKRRGDTEHNKAVQDLTVNLMAEAVGQFDGEVVQFLGDGIYALFGVPRAQEDYAINACFAALHMLEAVRQHPELVAEGIQIRVGLCAGKVMAGGVIGAFGKPVNFGAHMQQLAEKGEAWVSESTFRLVEGFFRLRPRKVPYKKDARPDGSIPDINVYVLEAAVASATPFAGRTHRKLTDFVGRTAELERLRHRAHATAAGEKRISVIEGPPGIGKSRLLHQFASELIGEGWAVYELPGSRGQERRLYGPFFRLLRLAFGIAEGANAAAWRAALTGKTRGRISADAIETVLFALGMLPDDTELNGRTPATLRDEAQDTLVRLLQAAAGAAPMLLVVEDLQWMDGQTRAVLERLFTGKEFTRLMIILTYRDSERRKVKLPIARDIDHIVLSPLPASMAGTMLDALLGHHSSLNLLKSEILEQSEGTPLFIEEMARMMVESAVLEGKPGDYRRSGDAKTMPSLPATVQKVFVYRVDNLWPRDKAILQGASVLGRTFSEVALTRLTGLRKSELLASLMRLAKTGLIFPLQKTETTAAKGMSHSFHHALCQQAVYGGLVHSDRVELHRGAMVDLETRFAGREQEVIEALAHHAYKAEQWEKAVHYLTLACTAAQKRWANREAVRIFEDGLDAVNELPEGPRKTQAELTLKLSVLLALRPLGQLSEGRKYLEQAERLGRDLTEAQRAPIYLHRALFDWLDGRHRHGLTAADRALAIPGLHPSLAVNAQIYRGMNLHSLGRFAEAIATLRQVRVQLTGEFRGKRLGWPGDPLSFCDTFLASSLTLTGQTDEARRLIDEAAAHAAAIQHPYCIAIINDALAEYHLQAGNPAAAADSQRRSLEICAENELYIMEPPATARLALAETRLGNYRQALKRLKRANAARMYRMGGTYAHGFMLHAQAEATAAAGQAAQALLIAEKAERRYQETGTRAALAQILLFRATLLKDIRQSPRSARMAAERALVVAKICGMEPLAKRCETFLKEFKSARKTKRTEEVAA